MMVDTRYALLSPGGWTQSIREAYPWIKSRLLLPKLIH